ncbi:MAG TPA: Nif3-like dinuclear metal center hexameric protein [Clostridiales bacterium]|jgi:dinuclear metal center YbgI/SA1388 family protein|nr:Nif3-like dinuclear metal center hexameric protein [Clostridiales bacterium]
MNIRELYCYLDKAIPPSYSVEGDRDGLEVCPDPDREVRRVLVALDVTREVTDEAIEGDFDLIVSHHPLVYKPLGSITPDDGVAAKVICLVGAGISVMSFHTRLDAVPGGVNDILAGLLGLCDVVPFGRTAELLGRIGKTRQALELGVFAGRVKQALAAPAVLVSDCGLEVSKVAVLGGGGGDYISAAVAAGADTFVSGRIGYHEMTAAGELGINLIEAGHFYTENPVCDYLAELITQADSKIETVYMKSCRLGLL